MAIATATNLYTSYSPITTKTRNNKSVSIPLQPGAYISRHVKFAVPTQKRTTLSISAASTTAIQVDGPTTSSKSSKTLPFRVGHGFDLHRLEPGYPLIIGGIDVPHGRGCEAHSDGNILIDSWRFFLPNSISIECYNSKLRVLELERDSGFNHFFGAGFLWELIEMWFCLISSIELFAGDVLLHCVVDAVLGALGLPDIGQIFPDSDPKWKGAPSSVFIKEAVSFFFFSFAYMTMRIRQVYYGLLVVLNLVVLS